MKATRISPANRSVNPVTVFNGAAIGRSFARAPALPASAVLGSRRVDARVDWISKDIETAMLAEFHVAAVRLPLRAKPGAGIGRLGWVSADLLLVFG